MNADLPTELSPGFELSNGYRIQRTIGRGNMGRVYEALQLRLDRICALKQTFYPDEGEREWFESEGKILSSLHHRCLPEIYDLFEERGSYFLAMQYVPGPSLKDRLEKSGVCDVTTTIKWTNELLDALQFLHSQAQPIIHRDIKPDNIKADDHCLFLLDFGLAKDKTKGTKVRGHTPHYASPEQQRGLETDERSDIYSLGATVYHLLTNILPPDALSREQKDVLRRASDENPLISEALGAVLAKATALRPEDRFGSVEEMRLALTDAALLSSLGEGKAQALRDLKDGKRALKIISTPVGEELVAERTFSLKSVSNLSLFKNFLNDEYNVLWEKCEQPSDLLEAREYCRAYNDVSLENLERQYGSDFLGDVTALANNADMHFQRGKRDYLSSNNPASAISELSAALRHYPAFHKAYYYRALGHLQAGDEKSATSDFTRALQLAPIDSLQRLEAAERSVKTPPLVIRYRENSRWIVWLLFLCLGGVTWTSFLYIQANQKTSNESLRADRAEAKAKDFEEAATVPKALGEGKNVWWASTIVNRTQRTMTFKALVSENSWGDFRLEPGTQITLWRNKNPVWLTYNRNPKGYKEQGYNLHGKAGIERKPDQSESKINYFEELKNGEIALYCETC